MERGRAAENRGRGSAVVWCHVPALVPGAMPGAQAGQVMLPQCMEWSRTVLGTFWGGHRWQGPTGKATLEWLHWAAQSSPGSAVAPQPLCFAPAVLVFCGAASPQAAAEAPSALPATQVPQLFPVPLSSAPRPSKPRGCTRPIRQGQPTSILARPWPELAAKCTMSRVLHQFGLTGAQTPSHKHPEDQPLLPRAVFLLAETQHN